MDLIGEAAKISLQINIKKTQETSVGFGTNEKATRKIKKYSRLLCGKYGIRERKKISNIDYQMRCQVYGILSNRLESVLV